MKSFLTTIVIPLLLVSAQACSSSGSKGGSHSPDVPTVTDADLKIEEGRWGDGAIPRPLQDGFFKDILFDFDSSTLPQEQKEQIKKNAQVLSADGSLKVEVEGHTDSRGTAEYNFALGEERARTVANLLVSYGVSPSQVSIISYGKEIPVDPSDNEQAWAKNRRVHFALFRPPQPKS